MKATEFKTQLNGYHDVINEIEVLQKYNADYREQRGDLAKIVDRYHPKKIAMHVVGIKEETRSAKTFRLASRNHYLPPFQAGQYISVLVDLEGVKTSRPYSIASSPDQIGYYEITVRRIEDGFVSNYLLDEVKVGDLLDCSAPAGSFFYNPVFHGDDLVFLAGGSGITPFMSMIREVTDRGLDRKVHLIYGNRITDDIIYRKELEERASISPNLTVTFVISEPEESYQGETGFLTASLIQRLANPNESTMFYICGPGVVYQFCRAELEKARIQSHRIRLEVSGQVADITKDPSWPSQLSPKDEVSVCVNGRQTFKVKAGEPLLNSLERHKQIVPSSCRSGECSLCRVKLISGNVLQPPSAKLRKSDRQFNYIHSCAAYPLSNLEIKL